MSVENWTITESSYGFGRKGSCLVFTRLTGEEKKCTEPYGFFPCFHFWMGRKRGIETLTLFFGRIEGHFKIKRVRRVALIAFFSFGQCNQQVICLVSVRFEWNCSTFCSMMTIRRRTSVEQNEMSLLSQIFSKKKENNIRICEVFSGVSFHSNIWNYN